MFQQKKKAQFMSCWRNWTHLLLINIWNTLSRKYWHVVVAASKLFCGRNLWQELGTTCAASMSDSGTFVEDNRLLRVTLTCPSLQDSKGLPAFSHQKQTTDNFTPVIWDRHCGGGGGTVIETTTSKLWLRRTQANCDYAKQIFKKPNKGQRFKYILDPE